jgi:signal transduction histidine kinase
MVPGRILAGALAGAAALLLLVLWLALHEPWLGVDLVAPEDGAAGLRVAAATAEAQRAGLRVGDRVQALRAGQDAFEIPGGWLVETPSYFIRYEDYNRFLAQQRSLHRILRAPEIEVVRDDGAAFRLSPGRRPLEELPAAFWYQIVYALLALSVGTALLAFRSGEQAARWYALASFCFFVGTLMRALYGSRELTVDADLLRTTVAVAHAAALAGVAALANFVWHFPRRLGTAPLPALALAFAALAWTADTLQWLPTSNLAYRGPLLLLCALVVVLALLQWRAARHDPVQRAMARWTVLLMAAGVLTWGGGLVIVALGHELPIPRGTHGVSSALLLYLGMVPLFLKHRAFDLERWWFEAWIWFLGGALVVGVDLLLVYALSLHASTALAISLVAVGWIYFPMRQWLLALLQRRQRDLRDLFPDLVRILLAPADSAPPLEERWRALLARVFEPRALASLEHGPASASIEQAGLRLVVPQTGPTGAIALDYANGGARLFSRRDARLAQGLLDLLRQGSGYQSGYWRGVASERERIARDLHDDIGAKLLTLIHESRSERIAGLARSAIAEMREVVTGLRAQPLELASALADWRAELAERAASANCAMQWSQPDSLPPHRLSPRQQLNLARILREATSNALRHAQARSLEAVIQVDPAGLRISLRHDGVLAEPAHWQEGTGLTTMRRRAADLGGTIGWRIDRSPPDRPSLRMELAVPLLAEATE